MRHGRAVGADSPCSAVRAGDILPSEMRPPTPKVNSFLIADHVFQQASGKWCLIGVFNQISLRRHPAYHPSLGLYLKLSDAEGEYDVRVELRSDSEECIATLGGIRMVVTDRLAEPQIGLQGNNLLIPKPGTYFLKVFFNDEPSEVEIRLQVLSINR